MTKALKGKLKNQKLNLSFKVFKIKTKKNIS